MVSYPSSAYKCKQATTSTTKINQPTNQPSKFNMKFLVVFALVLAVAVAAPANLPNADSSAVIVEQSSNIDPQGNFEYS